MGGISGISQLEDIATFLYRAELDNQLVEHELDHVLVACVSDMGIDPNICEVMSYRWWPQVELELAVVSDPELFTAWFPQVLDHVVQY